MNRSGPSPEGFMLTFIFLFFLIVCGIAAYFISVSAKKSRDGGDTRPQSTMHEEAKVGRATGSGDD
jgi:hypothetical protein